MILTELNPVGNFDVWEADKLKELKELNSNTPLGNSLLFENSDIKLWGISLKPGERLPFRIQKTNYNWICITGGLAISRFGDGKICLVKFEIGEADYWELEDSKLVCDLENIGGEEIKINIIEYKTTSSNLSLSELL